MPVRSKFPRTSAGHTWLKPFFDALDKSLGYVVPSGASGIPNAAWLGVGVPQLQVGNATGVVGFFGATGIAPVATGGLTFATPTNLSVSGIAATGMANSGLYFHVGRMGFDGGSGTIYTVNDVVVQLKNLGILTR